MISFYPYIKNYKYAYQAKQLRLRAKKLSRYLNSRGIEAKVLSHFRPKKQAHRWSTAYHIADGSISIGNLRKLKNGVDLDGNVWYQKGWDDFSRSSNHAANLIEGILNNAIALGAPDTVYSEEGYEKIDPRRIPNNKEIPISAHVYGIAIDIRIEWKKIGDPWGFKAIQLISSFGLTRPVLDEFWHFTLLKN